MLVEVFNSKDSGQVHLAYSLLQDREFFVRLENEHMNEIPGMSLGISLMVREEDYADARAVLEEAGYLPKDSAEIDEMEAILTEERNTLAKRMMFILIAIVVLLISYYIASRYFGNL